MTDSPHDSLIRGLAADLTPVRPLPHPALRALGWLAAVVALGLGLAVISDVQAMWARIAGAPDLWLAALGSAATAVLAGVAAFELSLPDARRAWALLPLPGALLWVGASGVGCLRAWIAPQAHVAALDETGDCLMFIVALSLPLSALLLLMLRRGCPLNPGLTATVAGLAVAAAAATLLNLFHPFDAAVTDLAVHAFAVALVVMANRALGGRIFAAPQFAPVK
ncbi:MAG: NrsF family protein [Pseudolabrys sp.]